MKQAYYSIVHHLPSCKKGFATWVRSSQCMYSHKTIGLLHTQTLADLVKIKTYYISISNLSKASLLTNYIQCLNCYKIVFRSRSMDWPMSTLVHSADFQPPILPCDILLISGLSSDRIIIRLTG